MKKEWESWLTPDDVGHLLAVSVKTLANWRVRGTGPPFSKMGHTIRYRYADIQTFMADRMQKRTTQRSVTPQ